VRYVLAVLVAAATAIAAVAPAAAQQDGRKPPAAVKSGRALIGLPLFSSDGKRIGQIVAVGTDDDNRSVLVAEIERPLGLGTDAVAIPFDLFVRKAGRVELTITAAEVEARISRSGRER
jgi:hypothetical protein